MNTVAKILLSTALIIALFTFLVGSTATRAEGPQPQGKPEAPPAPKAGPPGDITAVYAGTGLTGGGASGEVTITLSSLYQLPQGCGAGQVPGWTPAGWACATQPTGDVTAVYAGAGLSGGGTGGDVTLNVSFAGTGSVSTAARSDHNHPGSDITSPVGNAISATYAATATYATNATYATSAGNAASATIATTATNALNANAAATATYATNAVSAATAAALQGQPVSAAAPSSGQVLKWSGGQWAPADDASGGGTITGVTPSAGLTGGGSTGSVSLGVSFAGSGSANDVARSDHDHDSAYAAANHNHDDAYINLGEAASGDLSGTYPNPNVSRLQGRPVGSGTPKSGQVLKWDGAQWAPAADDTGGGAHWSLAGNAGTSPATQFLGTTDDVALELKVNGARAIRLEPNATSPNVIEGRGDNYVTAGVVGATIGGGGGPFGTWHVVTDDYGTVAGGVWNRAGDAAGTTSDASYSTVGGGVGNVASGWSATVGGGIGNGASLTGATVAGGGMNTASGGWATIPGGHSNTAQGIFSFAAGRRAKANHAGAFVWADSTDADFASTANDQFAVRASGGLALTTNMTGSLRLEPNASSPNLIGGYSGNTVDWGVVGGFIGGGGASSAHNRVTDDFGTIAGGAGNRAGDDAGSTMNRSYATVGGGQDNIASGGAATIAGGRSNLAEGPSAAVGGGHDNVASGVAAAVPGGAYNSAQGLGSFAAGYGAKAVHNGTFVWADATGADFASTTDYQFRVRASSGVFMYTNGSATIGAELAGGSGSWASVSDREAKENFAAADGRDVLEKVAALPISSWNYKSQDASIRHLGPMAQDFYAAFGVGEDDRHISTVDADGVALAAIQGLYQQGLEKDARIAHLEAQNAELRLALGDLRQDVTSLKAGLPTGSVQPLAASLIPGGWGAIALLFAVGLAAWRVRKSNTNTQR